MYAAWLEKAEATTDAGLRQPLLTREDNTKLLKVSGAFTIILLFYERLFIYISAARNKTRKVAEVRLWLLLLGS